MLNRDQAIRKMNEWGADGIPFIFFTDFLGQESRVIRLDQVDSKEVQFDFNGITNQTDTETQAVELQKFPVPFSEFSLAFDQVISEIQFGNSFLTNLTFETPVTPNADLKTFFKSAKAKYKLLFQDHFVCFSPETFIQIRDEKIHSFPMKGTIDARVQDAQQKILKDPKELAEHVTIVDLIRNDLSTVASDVSVERFRYVDEIRSRTGTLLQVSSEIVGKVSADWKANIGNILFSLLPAGSICGAPKPKTVEIIRALEKHTRGFYTGVCGLFDGEQFDSGVMIRFIEKRDENYFYKSGGGITAFSECKKEYQEYIDKIYVPIY